MYLCRVGRLFIILLLCILFSACAQTKYRFEYHQLKQEKVWPEAPEIPRYRYLGEITGEQNFVKEKGSGGLARQSLDWFSELIFGKAAAKNLHRPQAGYFDAKQKRIYVTDVGKKAVFVFDLSAKELNIWESVDGSQDFVTPVSVCVLADDKVYVSDAELGFVALFNGEGQFQSKLGEVELARPTGLACDQRSQKIYVADSKNHQVKVFSSEGKLLHRFGRKGKADGEFNSPTHISFNKEKVYVADTLNARIQIFDAKGNWLKTFGQRGMYIGNLPRPKGVAVDSENHIYVIESYYDFLLIFDEHGNPLLPIGGNGKGPGKFFLPAGVWVDNGDKVYVADMFNSRVAVFQYLKQSANR